MNLFESWLVERNIAHRGLHNENAPENTLPAFENAIKNSCPVELDVQQIADGTLVVFHDATLPRLTGKDGYVKNLNKADLKKYKILDTNNTIPTFEEVLNLIKGQVPILIEIKNIGKVGELEKALWAILKNYKGEYAIESFNPFSVEWFKKNAPNVIRGQLSSYFKDENLNFFKKYFLKRMSFNKKISEPHFISYDARTLPNRFVKKFKHLPLLAWTVRSQEEYLKVVPYCDNIIFENFEPKL
ncbi:MAG: glycerophosphodiester phosphodiesterase family protein [Clostridia bacterium]|nr:glycerophosphodiester phosphodiesterase family protein [Clostridia bacterium]